MYVVVNDVVMTSVGKARENAVAASVASVFAAVEDSTSVSSIELRAVWIEVDILLHVKSNSANKSANGLSSIDDAKYWGRGGVTSGNNPKPRAYSPAVHVRARSVPQQDQLRLRWRCSFCMHVEGILVAL